MEVILCSLWLGRRLRASLGHDGSSSGDEGTCDVLLSPVCDAPVHDRRATTTTTTSRCSRPSLHNPMTQNATKGGTDIGPCLQPRPIDWAALARAYPSSSKQQQEGEEADKAFRARVRVELDAAWTAMEGEVAGLRRRLGVVGGLGFEFEVYCEGVGLGVFDHLIGLSVSVQVGSIPIPDSPSPSSQQTHRSRPPPRATAGRCWGRTGSGRKRRRGRGKAEPAEGAAVALLLSRYHQSHHHQQRRW